MSIIRMLKAVIIVSATACTPAMADEQDRSTIILDRQLDNLESRLLSRGSQFHRTSDLLFQQDLRVAEQRLRTLKTRMPRNTRVPILTRQFEHIRRASRPSSMNSRR